jgi:hypothetical protein
MPNDLSKLSTGTLLIKIEFKMRDKIKIDKKKNNFMLIKEFLLTIFNINKIEAKTTKMLIIADPKNNDKGKNAIKIKINLSLLLNKFEFICITLLLKFNF